MSGSRVPHEMGATVTHLRGERPPEVGALVADLLAALTAGADQVPGDDGQLLTIDETAARLRVHRDTVSRLLDDGEIPTTRVGRLRRVRLADLLAYLDERRSP